MAPKLLQSGYFFFFFFFGRHFASLVAIFAGLLGIKRLTRTSPSQVMIAVLNSGDLSHLECLVQDRLSRIELLSSFAGSRSCRANIYARISSLYRNHEKTIVVFLEPQS